MRGVFVDDEQGPAVPQRETEISMGSGGLLALLVGVVLICGLCFGLGFVVGRRGSQRASAAMLPAAVAQTAEGADDPQPKPPATPQASVASASQGAEVSVPAAEDSTTGDSGTNSATGSQTSTPAEESGSPASRPQVRPAFENEAGPAQPAQPAVPLMVQIAAVSHAEDAQVLVDALHRRGYAVVARPEPADSLIHVRVGPFANRDEANRWRNKLLSDGYNAVVQP